MADSWSDLENDAIVADYMEMLADELAGRPYSKAEHNRNLSALIERGRGSIEYKHQNISAVLKGIGETWIRGYKPAYNFQSSLIDAVARWLNARPGWYAPRSPMAQSSHAVADPTLWIGPAPTLRNTEPPEETELMARIAQQFDAAERDRANRELGRAGEERVFQFERNSLRKAGRGDLAERVRWISQTDGDGSGFDILSFEADGTERVIEVKTTNGWERTPFHISRNEVAVSKAKCDHWHLIRVWNFARQPKAFALRPPLERHVSLTPTSYLAAFG
jgi:hypothetical protein